MSWFYYIVGVFVETNVPNDIKIDASIVMTKSLRLRVLDALGDLSTLGYYLANYNGYVIVGDTIKLCVAAEIGIPSSTKKATVQISMDVMCE